MNFWRAVLASLLSLVCTLAVSFFVTLATLQSTVLNRQEVKGWLVKSDIYKTALADLATASAKQDGDGAASSLISDDTAKTILDKTFSPQYVQQSTEKVIDSAYDWLDGKQPTIAFNINTTIQKDSFIANATSVLDQQLASLPKCKTAAEFNPDNPTCLPPGTSAQQLAQSLATDAANKLSILQQPLTNENLAQANNDKQSTPPVTPFTSASSPAQRLQTITANVPTMLTLLATVAVLSGGLMILLSAHKLHAAKYLSGRLTFGLVVTMFVGIIIANVGKTFTFSSYFSGANNSMVAHIIEPVLHQAAPTIGNRLALVSGILAAITGAAWIALRIIKQRTEKAHLLTPPQERGTSDALTHKPAATEPAAEPDPPKHPDKPSDTQR